MAAARPAQCRADSCGKWGTKQKICPTCLRAEYCSKECLKAHRKKHKKECAQMAGAAGYESDEGIKVLAGPAGSFLTAWQARPQGSLVDAVRADRTGSIQAVSAADSEAHRTASVQLSSLKEAAWFHAIMASWVVGSVDPDDTNILADNKLLVKFFGSTEASDPGSEDYFQADVTWLRSAVTQQPSPFIYLLGHGVPVEVSDQRGWRLEFPNAAWRDRFVSFSPREPLTPPEPSLDAHNGFHDGVWWLRKYGFMSFDGLFQWWESGIRSVQGRKHLMLVLDSCHSSAWIDRLMAWVALHGKQLATRDTHVTIQAACQADQSAYGKIFTPFFTAIHRKDSRVQLQQQFDQLSQEQRDRLQTWEVFIPRPRSYSTMPRLQEVLDTGTKLVDTSEFFGAPLQCDTVRRSIFLLPNTDAAFEFYMFCVLSNFGGDVSQLLAATPRKLQIIEIENFLRAVKGKRVKLLSFKLKTYSDGTPFAVLLTDYVSGGKPIGAAPAASPALVAAAASASAASAAAPGPAAASAAASSSSSSSSPMPSAGQRLVCMHVHYQPGSISEASCVNFFEHHAQMEKGVLVWYDPTEGSDPKQKALHRKESASMPVKDCQQLLRWIDEQMLARKEVRWDKTQLANWTDTAKSTVPFLGSDGVSYGFRSLTDLLPAGGFEARDASKWAEYIQREQAQA